MDLTAENKAHIDGLSYEGLLSRWRFAPVGDPWFMGEKRSHLALSSMPSLPPSYSSREDQER